MNRLAVSRSRVLLTSDSQGLHISVPDVVPSLESLLERLGWRGQPRRGAELQLGPAIWPSLGKVKLAHLPSDWEHLDSDRLWAAHMLAMSEWRTSRGNDWTRLAEGETVAESDHPDVPNLLDLKAVLAKREASPCRLCSIRCFARRNQGEIGTCGAGTETRAFSLQVLTGEEPGLGAGAAIRLSGCNCHCLHCTQPEGISARAGHRLTVDDACKWIDDRASAVSAIHWVGGNIDQELPFILEVMREIKTPLPVIWNHNSTATPEITLALLEGVVDVYLPDMRYGNDTCAENLGARAMSFSTCASAIEAELRQAATVCVRVLPIPGHLECCTRPILHYLTRYRDRIFLSLLNCSYMPVYRSLGDPVIGRFLDETEKQELTQLAEALGFRRVS